MQELIERIQSEAVHVGGGIVKVDSFLTHQVDVALMQRIGERFAQAFAQVGVHTISKVLTAEVSGLAPALAVAQVLAVPLVYAHKHPSAAMTDQYYCAEIASRTKGNRATLRMSTRYLGFDDQILLINDFLATGATLGGLIDLVSQSHATLRGLGCVIEKPQEGGRARLAYTAVPIISLAKIVFTDHTFQVTE